MYIRSEKQPFFLGLQNQYALCPLNRNIVKRNVFHSILYMITVTETVIEKIKKGVMFWTCTIPTNVAIAFISFNRSRLEPSNYLMKIDFRGHIYDFGYKWNVAATLFCKTDFYYCKSKKVVLTSNFEDTTISVVVQKHSMFFVDLKNCLVSRMMYSYTNTHMILQDAENYLGIWTYWRFIDQFCKLGGWLIWIMFKEHSSVHKFTWFSCSRSASFLCLLYFNDLFIWACVCISGK